MEPVVVAWDGTAGEIDLRLPSEKGSGTLQCYLRLETGEDRHWTTDLAGWSFIQESTVEGTSYVARTFLIPEALPGGYHG